MARKKTTKKNSAAKKTSAKAKKAPSSRKRKKASAKKTSASLGRPRIAGTAELDLEFKGDFGARQIFQFLDVQTFKELEEFSPQEITDRVITPLVQAVERIRKQLAMANRHLAGDQKFARSFQDALAEVTGATRK
ncbi:MAG: hypothetical protein MK004_01190 [Planctomycetales bacterium]|jgi:hypothetical protein|nr:hypothetical protein [Planctomycetales bacterium]